jgi:hypothetical protein
MVSCCEIHHSRLLMCFHLISNIGPVSEKISNQGPSLVDSGRRSVSRYPFPRNKWSYYISRWPAILIFCLVCTHILSVWVWCGDSAGEKEISICRVMILSSIHSIDSIPTFILIKAQTATSHHIRRSAKNKFGPGFSFSHVWKTGGSLQTADLISGKWNVYKSFWPGSIILVSFITISAFPSPILSQQQLRHTRGKIRGVSRISKRENSLVYKRRRMGGTGLDW